MITAQGILLRETDLAILLVQGQGENRREIWIPRGQIKHLRKEPLTEGWLATIEIPDWLAEAKEILSIEEEYVFRTKAAPESAVRPQPK